MRRLYGWLSLAILCGLFGATASAADPAPLAQRYAPAVGSPAPEPAVFLRAQAEAAQKAASTPPDKPAAPTFAQRMQAIQRSQQQTVADENRPKPSVWQLQNPPNATNYNSPSMTGSVATNNYFGLQFHSWNNISQPPTMTQLPFNQTAVPPINQTNLYTAPNNYFGGEFSSWSNLRGPQLQPNSFGGWNYR